MLVFLSCFFFLCEYIFVLFCVFLFIFISVSYLHNLLLNSSRFFMSKDVFYLMLTILFVSADLFTWISDSA